MKTVFIIVPENASGEEVITCLTDVINDLKTGFNPRLNMVKEKFNHTKILCENLIKKLGPVTNSNSFNWVGSFSKALYDPNDSEVTAEVVEYIANLEGKDLEILEEYNLRFLSPTCRSICIEK